VVQILFGQPMDRQDHQRMWLLLDALAMDWETLDRWEALPCLPCTGLTDLAKRVRLTPVADTTSAPSYPFEGA